MAQQQLGAYGVVQGIGVGLGTGLAGGGDWGLAVCMCMPHAVAGRARAWGVAACGLRGPGAG